MIPIHRTQASANSIMSPRNMIITAVVAFVVCVFVLITMNDEYNEEVTLSSTSNQAFGMQTQTTSGQSATSGKLFTGKEIRLFDRHLHSKFVSFTPEHAETVKKDNAHVKDKLNCTHWSVVTTIFEPSTAVRMQAHCSLEC